MIVSKRFQAAVVRYSNVLPSIECEYIVDEVLTPGIINHWCWHCSELASLLSTQKQRHVECCCDCLIA